MLSTKTAVWIFVLGCLLSSARLVVDTPGVAHDRADTVLRSGVRFAALRQALPDRGVIGYIGQATGEVGDYYLAQYALSPLVLDHSANHPIVVGNFPDGRPSGLPPNLKLVRDFGQGILLLANRDVR